MNSSTPRGLLKLVAGCGVVLFTLATEANPFRLLDSAEVVQRIGGAKRQILLASPDVLNQSVAQALLDVTRIRGIKVYIIVAGPATGNDASYIQGLSRVPNIRTRTVASVKISQLMIDNASVIEGPIVADNPSPDDVATIINRDPRAITNAVNTFQHIWRTARTYQLRYPRLNPKP